MMTPRKSLILFLFLYIPIFGTYVGNPAAPAIMNTGIFSAHNPLIKGTSGYIADYVSDKKYETSQEDPSLDLNDTFREFIIHSQLASLSVILLERLELFGTVGGSKERIKPHDQPKNTPIEWDFESDYHFSWSTGAKVVLIQWGQTYLSTDFTYCSIPESPATYFKFFNRLNLPMNFDKQKLSLSEWQTSLGLSSRIFIFTPYVGGNYMQSTLHIAKGEEIGSIEYKNKYKMGYFYGITASISGRFHLNFEQRFRSESAYSFSTIAVF